MISIITAVYNQLDMNKIFYEYLKLNTHYKYELIILDNGSSDGSIEFFKSVGAIVIENGDNYSYPVCQNKGIVISQYEYLAFLNNDIIVPKDWDKKLIDTMNNNQLEIITPSGIEKVESKFMTKFLHFKWKRIKNFISLFGISRKYLLLMHKIMYPFWNNFQERRWNKFHFQVKEGIVGNSVFMNRSALDKIGLWDERMQSADWDIYIRTKKRSMEVGDIKPIHIALGVFHHHYIRLTALLPYPPFIDKDNIIGLQTKWGQESLDLYLKDLNL